MSNSMIELLTKKQQYTRQRITKLITKIKVELNILTNEQRVAYIDRLKEISKELKEIHDEIFKYAIKEKTGDSELNAIVSENDEYDDKIQEQILSLHPPLNYSEINNTVSYPNVNSPQFFFLTQMLG